MRYLTRVAALLLPACTLLPAAPEIPALYTQLKSFALSPQAYPANGVTLKRGRVEMRFDGTFYAQTPIDGVVRGAVFLGNGTVSIDPPPVEYERENLRRMIKADRVESDFKTAVFRFSDDTWTKLALAPANNPDSSEAPAKLAREFAPRFLKETGINPDARLAGAILNRETPAVFFAQFDKGRLDRFTVALDFQGQIPAAFGLNGGEQGLVFAHDGPAGGNNIWLAFAGDGAGTAAGAPARAWATADSDQIRVLQHDMLVDLRAVKSGRLAVETKITATVLQAGLRAVTFSLNEGLGEYDDVRLKKALHCESVKGSGGALPFVMEPWEAALTVFLPEPLPAGAKLELELRSAGEAILRSDVQHYDDVFYPLSTTSWYPSYGYLQRSTYSIRFLHTSGHKVLSIGVPSKTVPGDGKGQSETTWKMDTPVAFASFAVGGFDRNARAGRGPAPSVEYYAPTAAGSSKQDFMLTELSNDVGYFAELFGPYPFPRAAAVVHPRPFGQSFPSLLLLAPTNKANNMYELRFFAHEMAHQWWGHVVGWKTYKDQWLSEGFAEYSGVLYVKARMDREAELQLVRGLRRALVIPPIGDLGISQGRVVDLGPIVLGLRAASPKTLNAYTALVYSKGALVLRMLHFLFTHPGTGDDSAFYAMMRDFTARYAGKSASTEDFFAVASEHFRRAPLGIKYKLPNLDWFARQWVQGTALPSYRMQYSVVPQGSGFLLQGVISQTGAPQDWFMPLPLAIRFGKDSARGSVQVTGAQSTFSIPLPAKPDAVLLDPDLFVLSEKTETVKTQ